MWNAVKFQKCETHEIMLFPQDKSWNIVDGLGINGFSQTKMDATAAELIEERDTALAFLGVWLDPAKPPDLHLDKTPDACLWHSPPNSVLLHIYVCMCVRAGGYEFCWKIIMHQGGYFIEMTLIADNN